MSSSLGPHLVRQEPQHTRSSSVEVAADIASAAQRTLANLGGRNCPIPTSDWHEEAETRRMQRTQAALLRRSSCFCGVGASEVAARDGQLPAHLPGWCSNITRAQAMLAIQLNAFCNGSTGCRPAAQCPRFQPPAASVCHAPRPLQAPAALPLPWRLLLDHRYAMCAVPLQAAWLLLLLLLGRHHAAASPQGGGWPVPLAAALHFLHAGRAQAGRQAMQAVARHTCADAWLPAHRAG